MVLSFCRGLNISLNEKPIERNVIMKDFFSTLLKCTAGVLIIIPTVLIVGIVTVICALL